MINEINNDKTLLKEDFKNKYVYLENLKNVIEIDYEHTQIFYISDIHLEHIIRNKFGDEISKEEAYSYIKYLVRSMVESVNTKQYNSYILIAGDTSSVFEYSVVFYSELVKYWNPNNIVVVLGNHELWNFSDVKLEKTVEKYRKLLQENDMYLLHNDIFYKNDSNNMGIIPYDELVHLDKRTIAEKLRYTRLVILGGLGFSGYNEEFNANHGMYRMTVDRDTEIQESKKFEQLYNKLKDVLSKKNTVIFTHTPKKDWCSEQNYHDNFVYVSGHTHKNIFFDDGVERVYADNQIGYRNVSSHLKSFLLDGEYDYFENYEDGVYEIAPQEYRDFARGMNIYMTFNRKVNTLYMLKKNGYYCFIHKTKVGSLAILNGGALKKLEIKDVQYYYDNMDKMIAAIKTPLNEYTSYEKSIANEVKKIGGSGRIHGCIIDIDFCNHIYVNPVDMKLTGYWASDIMNKLIYPDIPALLENKCPTLYSNYLKLLEDEKLNPLIVRKTKSQVSVLPQEYLKTDIYKVSREIKKMQKLNSNVLTTWYNFIQEETTLSIERKNV